MERNLRMHDPDEASREQAQHDARQFVAGGGDRPLPHAPEVEVQVLGAMLLDDQATSEAVALLPAKAFYDPRHRAIYSAARGLFEGGTPVDLVTVTDALRNAERLDTAGGAPYLSEIASAAGATSNVEYHARILLEKYYKRALHFVGRQIEERARKDAEDVFDLMEDAERWIFRIGSGAFASDPVLLGEGALERVEEVVAMEETGGITGIDTGFRKLNDLTGGWQKTDLIIVAARPSVGKTAFGLGQALGAAKQDEAVLWFSQEMGREQLRDRLLASEAMVDVHALRTGQVDAEAQHRLRRSARRLAKLRIYVDDTPGLSVHQVKAKTRQMAYRLAASEGPDLGLVVADYLQLFRGDRAGNREQEIASISRGFKETAKEIEIPFMALAQLSRSVESRQSKRPQLSDLRESGAIENDADLVNFLHRPEIYGKTTDEMGQSLEGKAFVILAKQRNGPIGEVPTAFVKRYAQFRELEDAPF